ncbi:phage tailspike protein [Yersinia aleksiciae]|uniref:phage tailspike protein n=1 Tax=Yersinia aleksiciae TaxID=263819 RepID=UPI0005DEBE78|nr:phage tailspike protein [Yersinia aleksiciae]CFQ47838.1 nitrous oxide reductase family maturation protein NosD [Yersinia aleksiciae]
MADIIPNIPVSMPSRLFTMPRKFGAIFGGRIYIGEIDTDPTIPSNQIQVFLENEDGSHVPVAQPLLINAGGYPVYNGQVAKFVTEQGYSMAVYDALNVQQFYFPNLSPPTAGDRFGSVADVQAANIPSSTKYINVDGYYSAGDGGAANYKQVASEPTHAGKIQSADGNWWEITETSISPEQLGAKGDGVTEDGLAYKNTIAVGRGVSFTAGRTYLINGVTGIPVKGQIIKGNGGILKKTDLTTDIPSIGVQDAPKFIKIDTTDDVTIDGVIFNYTGTSSPRLYGITVENSLRTDIKNCKFIGNETPTFFWKNSKLSKFTYNETSGGIFGIATGGDGAGNTNGPVTDTVIAFNIFSGAVSEAIDINWDTERCLIIGNTCYNNSLGVDEEIVDIGGGVCRDIWVLNNSFDGGGRTYDVVYLKGDTQRVLVQGNKVFNGKLSNPGSCVRVTSQYGQIKNVKIIDNELSGSTFGVSIQQGTADVIVSRNSISSVGQIGIRSTTGTGNSRITITENIIDGNNTASGQGIIIDRSSSVIISKNQVLNFLDHGIYIDSTAEGSSVSGNKVTNCISGIRALANVTTISENDCYLNKTAGISVTGSNSSIINNTCRDNAVTTTSFGLIFNGGNFSTIIGNRVYDTRTTRLQNGFTAVVPADRIIITDNLFYNNLTTNISGTGSLTNSVVANNITS